VRRLLVVTVIGVAGCAEATGIVVTANPVDQAVMGADTLRVFVGRETVEVSPAIRAHFDDGRAQPFEVDSFTAPEDILLSGDGTEPPFWIVVRAYDGDQVVGEGGVSHPLQLVAGEVHAISVDVHRVEGEPTYMPNCPGAGPQGDRDHIVVDLGIDDCDLDGDSAAAGDCDDFDASITAQTSNRACVVTIESECRLGVAGCGPAGSVTCTPSPTVDSIDPRACMICETSPDPLLVCLRDVVPIATCDIDFVPDGFCVPTANPVAPTATWHEDATAPQQPGGHASWHLGKPGLDYGWYENNTTFVSGETFLFPPAPAVKTPVLPLQLDNGDSDSLLVVITAPAGGPRITGLVDFRYHLTGDGGDSCPIDPNPDCTELPAP
jgi:hypothetical protein